MKLRMVHIVDGSLHKVLILDETKTREEGRLITWTESRAEKKAKDEAVEVAEALHKNGRFALQ